MDVPLVEVVPKVLQYAGALMAVGTVVAARLAVDGGSPAIVPGRLHALGRMAAALLVVAVFGRLVGHSVAAFGAADGLTAESLRTIAIESRWGAGWRWQVLAAAGVTAAALAPPGLPGRAVLFAAAVLAQAVAIPALGHAAGEPSRVALHAAHVLASGAWLGTLAVFVLAGVGRPRAGTRAPDADGGLIARFSPVALACAAAVGVSGVIAAVIYVGSPQALVESPYGRLLMAKLTAVGAAGGCGFMNWRRSRAGLAPSRGWLMAEAMAALLVVAASGVVTETEHP
ncbi:MAG: CopD family protein [Vicinamibacterales bacterium]